MQHLGFRCIYLVRNPGFLILIWDNDTEHQQTFVMTVNNVYFICCNLDNECVFNVISCVGVNCPSCFYSVSPAFPVVWIWLFMHKCVPATRNIIINIGIYRCYTRCFPWFDAVGWVTGRASFQPSPRASFEIVCWVPPCSPDKPGKFSSKQLCVCCYFSAQPGSCWVPKELFSKTIDSVAVWFLWSHAVPN